jgi:hypothetical protein
MKGRVCVAVLGCLLLSHVAQSQPGPGAFYARATVGVATQSMNELRDANKLAETSYHQLGAVGNIREFGAAGPIGAEAGVILSGLFSVGAGMTHQRSVAKGKFLGGTASAQTVILEESITMLTANAAYWLPRAPGIFVGANLGFGFARQHLGTGFLDEADPSLNETTTGDWDQHGVVGGVFAGCELVLKGPAHLSFKGGYQVADMGEMKGSQTTRYANGSAPTVERGPITDPNGRKIGSDFSGSYFGVGLGARFGRK